MQHAEVAVVGVDNDELCDAVGAHKVKGVDGIFGVGDALGVRAHNIGGSKMLDGLVGLEHAAQVAIGDDAEYLVVAVYHDGAAKAAGGHFEDGVAYGSVGVDEGTFVLSVEVADAHVELLAEGTAGVEACKVAGGEITALDEGHGEGIAEDELGGGAGSGSKVVGAGLVFDGGIEYDVGLLRQKRVGVAYDGDEGIAEVFDQWDENLDFGGVATLGEADDHVAGLYHAEVAVDGVGGMHEECGGAGAVEGGDDFRGDVRALANTGNYDPSRGRKNGFDSLRKAIIDTFFEILDSFFFICNNLYCNILYLL